MVYISGQKTDENICFFETRKLFPQRTHPSGTRLIITGSSFDIAFFFELLVHVASRTKSYTCLEPHKYQTKPAQDKGSATKNNPFARERKKQPRNDESQYNTRKYQSDAPRKTLLNNPDIKRFFPRNEKFSEKQKRRKFYPAEGFYDKIKPKHENNPKCELDIECVEYPQKYPKPKYEHDSRSGSYRFFVDKYMSIPLCGETHKTSINRLLIAV